MEKRKKHPLEEGRRNSEKESFPRAASFPEHNPNPVVEVDLEGAVCYVNPAGGSLFPDLERTGRSHPWLAGFRELLDRFRLGEDHRISRVVTVDGRHYHQTLKYIESLRRIRIYGTDITERVVAEETLRQRAEELETLLESVPALVWITHDPDARHITGNRAADAFLRIPEGGEASLTAPEGERPAHYRVLKDGRELAGDELPMQRAAAGEVVSGLEFDIEFDDGTVCNMIANATPLFNVEGIPRGAVAAYVDITGRKRMEEALRSSLAEKDLLLRELSHRTKNNMEVIVALLGLQASKSKDPTLVSTLAEAQHRIRAMALVYEKLYRSGSLSSLSLREYASDLVNSLLKAHQGAGGPVKLVLELDEIEVSHEAALPGGLILNELVSNSIKHAFPGQKAGTIFISLRQSGEKLELRYRDDGPGLPKDLDLSRVDTLGMKLVYNLAVRQLRGTMDHVRGPGTEFVFRFKNIGLTRGM